MKTYKFYGHYSFKIHGDVLVVSNKYCNSTHPSSPGIQQLFIGKYVVWYKENGAMFNNKIISRDEVHKALRSKRFNNAFEDKLNE